ncbi:transforming growth factor beta-1-induced transcript 1 protein-like [Chrysoperla carnea]|uniref:transforming growth factor beta-1-induced transcript 1 protein-like n=1 Tax=Chrysoperla carnea TaxID=189513 RepID=UPI001D07580F|nr:transforming growth factor beta-1-induced transcript 1 protein-like [Chrysoperla carnea]XP_044730202.1 transforming growth factor beta-1-induced transcript 1 protein-like [Chrysoperla carnea]XP_044730203.1 transforming growth factor beta-1-induced transcript 1 protein-like [Chrysoperla carnea]XP_044730204.1 transforming growth factor beta-1-induced transcript 1 protein-like [Chrysoperla carnea]XP_044730205.1 transforming growth factor beta-1-induced transcript 1 protein-like [Chrysoperla car
MSDQPPAVICVVCNEPITSRILKAMGKTYHPEHFKCAGCEQTITNERFHVDNNEKIYCEPCYTKMFLSKCKKCGEPIKERLIKALGADWHEDHFVCAQCGKVLHGVPFYEKDGLPYCEEDFTQKFAPKCKKCGKPIVDQVIKALDAQWHAGCFVCCKCNSPITDSVFQIDDKGMPICSKCAEAS